MHIGSFNVRGIKSEIKKVNLIDDVIQYGCSILAIQETKIQNLDRIIKKYRLITFKTECINYGLGFVLSPKINSSLHSSLRINDRIVYIID